ncbi:hypothetical protein BO71DRAFT_62770 [Aspergillus ellipticus CBS 707.79]|uniref:Uncharacterized protein n=1 Tax=Aspergillus ellipticus CBS 707.79 TaxID=1448320 RepID=A0A319DS64_9EURO|nr:hypothetical protein BO71DRAFT_62770 [Aspergillus ellipticus CBS 707.79]
MPFLVSINGLIEYFFIHLRIATLYLWGIVYIQLLFMSVLFVKIPDSLGISVSRSET